MSSKPPSDAPGLRDGLVEILESCPVLENNPEECPLFGVRTLLPVEREQWANTLSDEELTYLAAYHHVCCQLKIAPRT